MTAVAARNLSRLKLLLRSRASCSMRMRGLWRGDGLLELFRGVDVAKRVRFVVECDFDGLERRVPGVDLAPAPFEKAREMREQRAPDQSEHRVRLIKSPRDRKFRAVALQRVTEARDQI